MENRMSEEQVPAIQSLPLLTWRDVVVFPHMVIPRQPVQLMVGEDRQ